LLSDLHEGIFSELSGSWAAMKIDPYRRNLQRAFVDILAARLTPAAAAMGAAPAVKDDTRAAFRAELKVILDFLAKRDVAEIADTVTKNHLADLRDQISQILEPKK
jgi:hypothetical protein